MGLEECDKDHDRVDGRIDETRNQVDAPGQCQVRFLPGKDSRDHGFAEGAKDEQHTTDHVQVRSCEI